MRCGSRRGRLHVHKTGILTQGWVREFGRILPGCRREDEGNIGQVETLRCVCRVCGTAPQADRSNDPATRHCRCGRKLAETWSPARQIRIIHFFSETKRNTRSLATCLAADRIEAFGLGRGPVRPRRQLDHRQGPACGRWALAIESRSLA